MEKERLYRKQVEENQQIDTVQDVRRNLSRRYLRNRWFVFYTLSKNISLTTHRKSNVHSMVKRRNLNSS
jgi:hypothetical protein